MKIEHGSLAIKLGITDAGNTVEKRQIEFLEGYLRDGGVTFNDRMVMPRVFGLKHQPIYRLNFSHAGPADVSHGVGDYCSRDLCIQGCV